MSHPHIINDSRVVMYWLLSVMCNAGGHALPAPSEPPARFSLAPAHASVKANDLLETRPTPSFCLHLMSFIHSLISEEQIYTLWFIRPAEKSIILSVTHLSCRPLLSLSLLSQCLVSLSLGGAKWCSCGGIRGRSSCSGIFIDLGSLHSWLLTSDKSNFELTASVEFIYRRRCGNLHHLVSWNTCIQHVSFSLLDYSLGENKRDVWGPGGLWEDTTYAGTCFLQKMKQLA